MGIYSESDNKFEKIIQFGTGMLLRALPDWLIDQANKQGRYSGRIVMVKSTSSDKGPLEEQQGRYTIIERGTFHGESVNRVWPVTSVSRILAAATEWDEVLALMRSPLLELVISNTTEAGLAYRQESLSESSVPLSFPGKLTRCLLERFRTFEGSAASGLIILPTELLVNNGLVLRDFVLRHARENNLGDDFIIWLERHNRFCSTLVDRIVPGKCEPDDMVTIDGTTFRDAAHTAAEPYLLWAIEGDEEIRQRIRFYGVHPGLVITTDLTPYREQKLRILNGSNTMVAAVGWLAGCNTTYDTMVDALVSRYTIDLIHREILPTITDQCPNAEAFAQETLDRFRNASIRYPLLTIARQYSSKMNSRNVETIFRYAASTGRLPQRCCIGLAAFFVFWQAAGKDEKGWYGMRGTEKFYYEDDHAQWLAPRISLMGKDAAGIMEVIAEVLNHKPIFTRSLTELPDLTATVAGYVMAIQQKGMAEVLRNAEV